MIQKYSQLGLGFAVSIAFWPGLLNAGTAPRWAVLALLIPLVALLSNTTTLFKVRWTLPFILPFFISALIIPIATPEAVSWASHVVIMLMALLLGASLVDGLKNIWTGLAWGICLSVSLGIAQFFGLELVSQAVAPAGLFMNKNILAESCAIAMIIGAAISSLPIMIIALVGISITMSKATIGALFVTLVFWLFHSSTGREKYLALGFLGFISMVALVPDWASLHSRIEIWGWAIRDLAILGNGIGSFQYAFPDYTFVHMETLELAYELGLLSLPILGAIALLMRNYHGTLEESIVLAIIAISFFAFPAHMPVTGFALALALGGLIHSRSMVRLELGEGRVRFSSRPDSAESVSSSFSHRAGQGSGTLPFLGVAESGQEQSARPVI